MILLFRLGILAALLSISCNKTENKISPSETLLFTKTNGYRHESINTAISVLKSKEKDWNLNIDQSEDAS
jgi:hypothetical protein